MIRVFLPVALAALAGTLAACGQKGPLYLPDTTQGEVVTRPASTGPANSPAPPDSPDRAASPAPEVTAPVGAPVDEKDKDKKQPPK